MRERGRLTRMPFLIIKIENGCIGILAYGNGPVKKKVHKGFPAFALLWQGAILLYIFNMERRHNEVQSVQQDISPDEKRRCRHSTAALAMILDKKIVSRDDFVARYGMSFQETERYIDREDTGARCNGLHRKRLVFRRDMGNQQRA